MVVFIEYVLIDNFVIDYLLLKFTLKILKIRVSTIRLIICGIVGAVEALVFPLVNFNSAFVFPLKILCGLLLSLICTKHRTVKEFYITSFVFLALTFATGGFIYGIYGLFGIRLSTEVSIAVIILPVYFVIKTIYKVLTYTSSKQTEKNNIYRCEISVNNICIDCVGFMDTGNSMEVNGCPVIICNRKFFLRFFKGAKIPALSKTECVTAIGKKHIIVCDVDFLKIYYGQEQHTFNNVKLGVVSNRIGDFYDLILQKDLKRSCYEFDCNVKKIS